jgi:hypothetical protein
MSRDYRIWVRTEVADVSEAIEVEEAVEALWPVRDDMSTRDAQSGRIRVSMQGDGRLTGGQTFEEFAASVQAAIWRRVQRYVPVSVSGACLEPDDVEVGTSKDFEAARDAGLLNPQCGECEAELAFACGESLCDTCRKMVAMEAKRDG